MGVLWTPPPAGLLLHTHRECLDDVAALLGKEVEAVVDSLFGRFPELASVIRSAATDLVDSCKRETRSALEALLAMENCSKGRMPFTLNSHYFTDRCAARFKFKFWAAFVWNHATHNNELGPELVGM